MNNRLCLTLLVALFVSSYGACAGEPAPEPDLGTAQGYLAEGRSVRIKVAGTPLGENDEIPSMDPRAVAGIRWAGTISNGNESWIDLIAASCDFQARSIYGKGGEATAFPVCPGTAGACLDPTGLFYNLSASGAVQPAPTTDIPTPGLPQLDANAPLSAWAASYSRRPYVTQALLLCAGQRFLEIAKSLRPTVFRGRETVAGSKVYNWIIATGESDAWPDAWNDHFTLLANSNAPNNRSFVQPPLSNFKELFSIPPPPADEAATWALLAIDFLRESAMLGAYNLNPAIYPRTSLQGQAQLAGGAVVTLEQMILGNTSDALTSMTDASEWAERYAGAASPARPDITPANLWRDRYGSRLEAARTFAAVPAEAFDSHGVIPLFKMIKGTGMADVRETTDLSVARAVWGNVQTTPLKLGWLYSPSLPPPDGAVAVYQYEKLDNALAVVDSVLATAAQYSVLTGYTRKRLEGYVLSSVPANNTQNMVALNLYKFAGNPTASPIVPDSYKADVPRADGTPPSGGTLVGAIGYVYRSVGPGNNTDAPALQGNLPIVSKEALSQSSEDRIAEKRIRDFRVSPICLKGHPRCAAGQPADDSAACLCPGGGAYGKIDAAWVAQDLMELEKLHTFKSKSWANTAAYLKDQPFNEEQLKIAIQRIVQEAAALGHVIQPLPEGTQNITDQIIMVSGTTRDFRPVEPTYLQAVTDGAAQQFVTEPAAGAAAVADPEDRSGLAAGTAPKLRGAFARRGMYHTALFVRRALKDYQATGAGPTPALLQVTLDKLNAWIDNVADGWVRFTFTRPSATQYTVTAIERESVRSAGLYELWKGEAGLECALTGAVSGLTCDENLYRLGGAAANVTANAIDAASGGRIATGTSTWAPTDNFRIFLTKNLGRKRRGVAGVTIPSLAVGGSKVTAVPMMSRALADAYMRTLAPDPTATYRAQQYCGGLIDYDIRVKLADDITRAQGGSDSLSESMEYYLKNAETAAARSDELGEQIVESGLQMDTRAEKGSDDLEDLCGVQTDAQWTTTTDGTVTVDDGLTVVQGQAGYSACTVAEKDLEWLSVGSRQHCVWRWSETSPPCECGGDTTCEANKARSPTCPSLPVGGTQATAAEDCAALFPLFSGKTKPLETLGYTIDQDSQGESPSMDVPRQADRPPSLRSADVVGRCDMLAGLYAGEFNNTRPKNDDGRTYGLMEARAQFPWLDFDEIREVAQQIGWDMDPYGLVTLTLRGEPWLKVGSFKPEENPAVENIKRPAMGSSTVNRQQWSNNPATGFRVYTEFTKPAGCSKFSASSMSGLLACEGAGVTPVNHCPVGCSAGQMCCAPLTGEAGTCKASCTVGSDKEVAANSTTLGVRNATRIYEALDALENLTGAAGPRQGWVPLTNWGDFQRVAMYKEYVYQTDPITGAELGSLFRSPAERYVFWANIDDKKQFFVTETLDRNAARNAFLTSFWGANGVEEWVRDPWNWKGSAAFKRESQEAEVDDAYDADEFSSNGDLWHAIRDPKGGDHKVVEWSYKAKNSGWKRFWRGANRRWVERETTLRRKSIFDAFSLACMALDQGDGVRPSVDGCASFFSSGGTPSLRDAANAADCVAQQANAVLDEMYVPGVPKSLKATLLDNQAVQVLPEFSGQYAEAVSSLGSELGIYRGTVQAISRATNEMAYHTRTVGRAIDKLENEAQITEVQLRKDIANQITACLAAIGENGGFLKTISSNGTNQLGTAATCANSAAQTVWSVEIEKLQQENIELSEKQALDDFNESVRGVMARIDGQIEALRRSQAAIHSAIARMDSIRRQAKRAESRAKLAIDAGQGRVNHVNAVMRARMNTSLARYDRAFTQAVRYGYLARRGIEERIGMPLDMITKKASLTGSETTGGEAPYQWAEDVCTMAGLDYQRIAGHLKDEAGNALVPTEDVSYASSYVGDYVVRLRDFLASYRFDYPFQDGKDQIVVSVRDELQGIRRLECPVEGPNYLLDTQEPHSDIGIWTCNNPTPAPLTEVVPPAVSPARNNCASFRPVSGVPGPAGRNNSIPVPVPLDPKLPVPGLILEWRAKVVQLVAPSSVAAATDQLVDLTRGDYTLSWYERCDLTSTRADVQVRFGGPDSAAIQTGIATDCTCGSPGGCATYKPSMTSPVTWIRRVARINAAVDGVAWVGFGLPANSQAKTAFITGPQLEAGPTATGYFPTNNDYTAPVGICEDDGKGFRSWDNWTYRCETYCPAGTGNNCEVTYTPNTLPKACYFETRFNLAEDQIDRGRLIQQAGFARGNFNYRVDQIAVNFVGTGLRSCEGAELSSSCYAGNFLQYSIEHVGPYRVRNHDGDLYPARLFTGRIQQVKGLAAERYLTNPLSSADRSLMTEYMRDELKGRPLDGTYLLRVYDNEALNWSKLEDIQLLINYRYWTRLD